MKKMITILFYFFVPTSYAQPQLSISAVVAAPSSLPLNGFTAASYKVKNNTQNEITASLEYVHGMTQVMHVNPLLF
jgi:hypothetical protein